MIIIHNAKGGLVAIAGLALAVVMTLVTAKLWLGLAFASAIWIYYGWPTKDEETQKWEFYPHVFFIPLPLFGVIALLIAVFAFLAVPRLDEPRSPLAAVLDNDEKVLANVPVGGNEVLSAAVRTALRMMPEELVRTDGVAVFSRSNVEGKVLVLVKVPLLKEAKDPARIAILSTVEKAVMETAGVPADRLYVGVKGKFLYGAIRTPTSGHLVGGAVDDDKLLPFYAVRSSTDSSLPLATPQPTTVPAR
jgi:hypothetical protein